MSPNQYLKKPYTRVIIPDADSETYTALIEEFPGCIAQGETVDIAYANLERAAESWIEAAVELGQSIPDPRAEEILSGKVALRLPKKLHRDAAKSAAHEGVSLNQYIVAAVAERVGTSNALAFMRAELASYTKAVICEGSKLYAGMLSQSSVKTLQVIVQKRSSVENPCYLGNIPTRSTAAVDDAYAPMELLPYLSGLTSHG